MEFIKKIKSSFANSFTNSIKKIFGSNKNILVDQQSLQNLEKLLINSDVSIEATKEILEKFKKKKIKDPNLIDIKSVFAETLSDILQEEGRPFTIETSKLNIILLTGINGSGKTSTLAKLVHLFKKDYRISIAACDTFRAAALDQLTTAVKKCNPNIKIDTYIPSEKYRDPSALAYFAISESLKKNIDILFIDTAGRLQNNTNLMEELSKMERIIQKFAQDIFLYNLITIDSTIGQNSIKQVEEFSKFININGIIITKLDSTSKAGAIFTIKKRFDIPIYFVTFGEKIEDLALFNKNSFICNLLDMERMTNDKRVK